MKPTNVFAESQDAGAFVFFDATPLPRPDAVYIVSAFVDNQSERPCSSADSSLALQAAITSASVSVSPPSAPSRCRAYVANLLNGSGNVMLLCKLCFFVSSFVFQHTILPCVRATQAALVLSPILALQLCQVRR